MFENLNNKQKEAVNHVLGPLLIVAGAGSGKTGVITCKIAKLIIENYATQYEVTAVTFTNKAANEMKERVRKLTEGVADVDLMLISTFHSYCAKVLRLFIDKIGFDKNFVIYDVDDQKHVVATIIDRMGIDKKEMSPKDIVSIFNAVKNGTSYLRANSEVEKIFIEYKKELRKANALDFGDLLTHTVKLFKADSEALEYFQDRAKFFFVDEYQDTNRIQYELVKLISSKHRNICVVGDEDQSIYKWRGADIRNILEFEKDYKDSKIIKLEENYRSTKNIISASSSLISNNLERKNKVLFTNNLAGDKVNITELDNDISESEFICKTILDSYNKGFNYSDCAIFYRINAQSRLLEEKLRYFKIPYKIVGGIRFYERKEIKDLICYLRVILNPNDNASLLRIINTPARSIGKATLEKLQNFSVEINKSIYESILTFSENNQSVSLKLLAFKNLIELFIMNSKELKPSLLLKKIIDDILYLDFLKDKNNFDADDRIENISSFVNAMADFEELNKDATLYSFLESITLLGDSDSEEGTDNGVKLMTLHSSKGLEFPIVFIQGVESGLLPYVKFGELLDNTEEERRLMYVGMTRAKQKLFLTYAGSRKVFGGAKVRYASEFLSEIDANFVNKNSKIKKYNLNLNTFNDFDTQVVNTNNYVGSKVKHASYGDGVITACDGAGESAKVTVFFKKYGTKKLMWEYANLTLL